MLTTSIYPFVYESRLQIFSTQCQYSTKVYSKRTKKYVISIRDHDNRHPKVQLELIKELFYQIFSLDGILQGMRMHILLNLPTTTNKQSSPSFVLGKPLIKSIDLFSMVQQVQLRDDITLGFCEQACWYNKECIL